VTGVAGLIVLAVVNVGLLLATKSGSR